MMLPLSPSRSLIYTIPFGVTHVCGSIFRLERGKCPYNIVCCIEIGIKWIYWTHGIASKLQMPWKVAISHIQNAIKATFLKGISWNLLHTFFRDHSSTYIPLFIWGFFFAKIKKCWQSQISKFRKIRKIWDSSFVVNSLLSMLIFSDCLYL